jgi:glutamate-1-semialdehyde 2,1-aminomutase
VRVPGFSSTGSKRPEALFGTAVDVPLRMTRAEGCTVWDDAGREYLDLIMGLGAVALGYAHPAVVRAAEQALREGTTGPLPPSLEERVAERLCTALPGAEAVRFLKTGAEAMAAAVRIARVETGRDRVVHCGYHGWLDWCQDEPGVPSAVRALCDRIPFNDVTALDRALDTGDAVAAIVVEPLVDEPPSDAWLAALRDRASRSGSVLVFDEIKTAFRLAIGGVAERWGVTPDLIVVGKALGNGLPIAAVAGGRDTMAAATRTWISSTLAAEAVGLAAADAVLGVYDGGDVTGHLAHAGQKLFSTLSAIVDRYPQVAARVRGVPEMCYIQFRDDAVSTRVAQAAARRGLLFKRTAYNFVSLAHSDAVMALVNDRLRAVFEEVASQC